MIEHCGTNLDTIRSAHELLAAMDRAGGRIISRYGQLEVSAPPAGLAPELRAAIVAHKDMLLEILERRRRAEMERLRGLRRLRRGQPVAALCRDFREASDEEIQELAERWGE
jgi:hypothetical protein